MKRAFGLLVVPALFVACAGGSKGAKIAGLVHDPGGVSIPGAMVSIQGAPAQQTASDGTFALDVGAGLRHVGVTAGGFYPLDTDVKIVAGMNQLDLILQPCDPLDTSCTGATPTPTATPSGTPTAPPNANIIAAYDGSNWPGPGNNPPAWTGTAHNNLTNRTWGDGGNGGNNYGLTECYKSATENGTTALAPGDTADMIHHCWVDWYLFNGATNTGMGYLDSLVELYVDGATWRIAAPPAGTAVRCSIELGTCTLKYYEVTGSGTVTEFASATAGIADIEQGGFVGGQAVKVSNGAFTGLDFP